MKKNNKKGFTLAELLIVVAIIAVLTAIAIPVFGTQLEKSREATDLANVRAAYADIQVKYLEWDGTSTIASITVPAKQAQANWQCDGNAATTKIAEGVKDAGIDVPATTKSYVVAISTADGSITVTEGT